MEAGKLAGMPSLKKHTCFYWFWAFIVLYLVCF